MCFDPAERGSLDTRTAAPKAGGRDDLGDGRANCLVATCKKGFVNTSCRIFTNTPEFVSKPVRSLVEVAGIEHATAV